MSRLNFLCAGIPHTTFPRNTINGLKRIHELRLDGMELEWVHQVPFDDERAKEIFEVAKKLKLELTVHGSYYINLAALEKPKLYASISRILKAAKIGSICGAKKLTFHPAFYQKQEKKKVFDLVQEALGNVLEKLGKEEIDIQIAPELTGKPTQFGDLEELVTLVKGLDQKIRFCLDFSHLHARTNGKFNTKEEFKKIFEYIKKNLGKEYLSDMYFHISGILYGEKGEKRHVCFLESEKEYEKNEITFDDWDRVKLREVDFIKGGPDIRWREILQIMKEYNVGGHLVVESPNLEKDTLMLRNYYRTL